MCVSRATERGRLTDPPCEGIKTGPLGAIEKRRVDNPDLVEIGERYAGGDAVLEATSNYFTIYDTHKSQGKNALAPVFDGRENWPLRGMFWLSKDLEYDSDIYVEDSLEPGATELRKTRNELEHGYLKLHQDLWPGSESEGRITDALATSVYRDEFESRAVTTVRKARAALIYLSLGIQHEEQMKRHERDDDDVMSPFHLGRWEDDWKR